MKCPYQYDVKVEPSNGCGMKNDGFKSETDDNSLERGVSPPDFNEKGSLEMIILSNPYSAGKPFVLGTVITVSEELTSAVIDVRPTTTSGTRLSTLRY